MTPGPDLDAEIARKVLEVVVIMDTATGAYQLRDVANKRFIPIPPYSTDTSTAHELLRDFKNMGCTFQITAPTEQESQWSVAVSHNQIGGVNFGAKGQTLPHAICQAILQFNSLFKLRKTS